MTPEEAEAKRRKLPLDWREQRYSNGAPKWSEDGTLLDDNGNRSIFDDVDE